MVAIPDPPMPNSHHHAGWGTGTIASLGRKIPHEAISRFWEMFATHTKWTIDTADSYGSGDAERLLARLLPEGNNSLRLITKAGYIYSHLPVYLGPANQIFKKLKQKIVGKKCFAPAYLERCLQQSLVRLHRPMVSAFLLHDPPASAVQDRDLWYTLRALRDRGLTAKIGLSSSNREIIETALATGEVEVLQTPANLLKASELKDVWRKCHHQGVDLVGNHLFPPLLVKQHRLPHIELAKASAALLPPGSTLLCGTHNPDHLRDFAHWIEEPLSQTQLAHCFHQAGLAPQEFSYV